MPKFIFVLLLLWIGSCFPHAGQKRTARKEGGGGAVANQSIPVSQPGPTLPVQDNPIDRLKSYCDGGEYRVPNEPVCSRAPNCKSDSEYSYDNLAQADRQPDHMLCLDQDNRGCQGYVPFCCYVMAETGDFTACVGYWERLWCSESQCEAAKSNGASDDQCGGQCQCAHASKHYCKGTAPVKDLAERLPQSL